MVGRAERGREYPSVDLSRKAFQSVTEFFCVWRLKSGCVFSGCQGSVCRRSRFTDELSRYVEVLFLSHAIERVRVMMPVRPGVYDKT